MRFRPPEWGVRPGGDRALQGRNPSAPAPSTLVPDGRSPSADPRHPSHAKAHYARAGAGRVLSGEAEKWAGRPHVVILGAGASRAACPKGDKNGEKLPLMVDLAEVAGMKDALQGWGIDYKRNFEDIFSELYEKGEADKTKELQRRMESYFGKLELPDGPTLYDLLVLSLGKNDIIATFNWDPLLAMAMERNVQSNLGMPQAVYPHGNVRIGYCERDKKYDRAGRSCTKCGEPYKDTPLLYPIRQKDYNKEPFVQAQWNTALRGLRQASVLTVFGYSAPKTDVEALKLVRNAWKNNKLRDRAEIEFIVGPDAVPEEVRKAWEPVIGTSHCRVLECFSESSIAHYPRRTGEAYERFVAGRPVKANPVPDNLGFEQLWEWMRRL